jgi:hypothetical protein
MSRRSRQATAEPEREPDINLTETHFGAKAATTDEPRPEPEAATAPAMPVFPPLEGAELDFYHAAVVGLQKAQGAADLAIGIIRERRGIPSHMPVRISLDGQVQIGQAGPAA